MKKTIWIIDDDQSILEVLKLLLEEKGFNPVTMQSADILNKHLKRNDPPAIIVIDVHIAGVDGRDVVQELKSHETFKEIPVLLMTADIHAKEKALEAQADGYVSKPFEIEQFLKSIEKYMKPQYNLPTN